MVEVIGHAKINPRLHVWPFTALLVGDEIGIVNTFQTPGILWAFRRARGVCQLSGVRNLAVVGSTRRDRLGCIELGSGFGGINVDGSNRCASNRPDWGYALTVGDLLPCAFVLVNINAKR